MKYEGRNAVVTGSSTANATNQVPAPLVLEQYTSVLNPVGAAC